MPKLGHYYDRSHRCWMTTDGAAFPIDRAGARHAQKSAFVHQMALIDERLPQLVQKLTTKCQPLERRAWKAAHLVATNGVSLFPNEFESIIATVRSSSVEGDYVINRTAEDGYTCDCMDFVDMQSPMTESGQRYCKHIIAAVMTTILES